ncbi:MAG: hypothetical protein RSE41_00500 [Clostridia bacterium]
MILKQDVEKLIKEYALFNINYKYCFNKKGYFWTTPTAYYGGLIRKAKKYKVHYLTAYACEAYCVLKGKYIDINEMEKILF